MKELQIVKEYNNASSTVNNMDVFDVYVNDWGVLQYGFKYNEFSGLSDCLEKQKEYNHYYDNAFED